MNAYGQVSGAHHQFTRAHAAVGQSEFFRLIASQLNGRRIRIAGRSYRGDVADVHPRICRGHIVDSDRAATAVEQQRHDVGHLDVEADTECE